MKFLTTLSLLLLSFQASAASRLMNQVMGGLLNGQAHAEFYGKTHDQGYTSIETINGVQQPPKQVYEGRDCRLAIDEIKDGIFTDFKATLEVDGQSVDVTMNRGMGGVNPDEVSWHGWDHNDKEVRFNIKVKTDGRPLTSAASNETQSFICFFDDK
ncbi:MAG: hypothetical protein ACXVA9_10540 [Bdellovibrionales bacterium]